MSIRVSVKEIGKIIGGKVQQNIEMPKRGFKNACPIRMSDVLNKTGFPIRKSSGYEMVSGRDGMWCIYRVPDRMDYPRDTFGAPDKHVNKKPETTDFEGLKGIVVVKGSGWENARGHVTLWDGAKCSDSCHLMHDPDNGSFVPKEASIWVLR
jgi:hypothetical protein